MSRAGARASRHCVNVRVTCQSMYQNLPCAARRHPNLADHSARRPDRVSRTALLTLIGGPEFRATQEQGQHPPQACSAGKGVSSRSGASLPGLRTNAGKTCRLPAPYANRDCTLNLVSSVPDRPIHPVPHKHSHSSLHCSLPLLPYASNRAGHQLSLAVSLSASYSPSVSMYA